MRWMMVAAAVVMAPGAAGAQAGDAGAGRVVAQTWCAQCHAVEARPVVAGDATPGFTAIANRTGVTADGLGTYLAEPHGRMPNLYLSRADIADVVAYLLSLKQK